MNVQDKAAIITGGGTGVGRATALALARLGCHVAINYSRSKAEAEATAAECERLGVKALAIKADVADDAAVRIKLSAESISWRIAQAPPNSFAMPIWKRSTMTIGSASWRSMSWDHSTAFAR
jgi:shikimate 5-dehydrogenase